MAHTPGPWVIIDGEIQPGVFGKGIFGTRGTMREPIASIFHMFPDVAEANARLMGNALLMFEALEAQDAFWNHFVNCSECEGTAFCAEAMILALDAKAVRTAALAAARGECDAPEMRRE